MEAREALVAAINDFAGAVVLVTHDWHLLSLVADRLWLVAEGSARPFDGDLEDYRRYLADARATADETPARQKDSQNRRDARRAAAERRQALGPLRRELQTAERRLGDLTDRKSAVDRQLAEPEVYAAGGSRLEALLREQATLAVALAEAETRWLAAADALDQADN
jgi:ATP-binding cassette subfamily F protein 3